MSDKTLLERWDESHTEAMQWAPDEIRRALAAVEAYKASLKPAMWGMLNDRGGWIKVAINGSSDEEMLTLGWIPLYRLDGGDDE